jgi:hypothetical protein
MYGRSEKLGLRRKKGSMRNQLMCLKFIWGSHWHLSEEATDIWVGKPQIDFWKVDLYVVYTKTWMEFEIQVISYKAKHEDLDWDDNERGQ